MSGLSIAGVVIFLLGAFLFIGNVLQFFPTVPLAGWLTMIVGGAIFRAGER